MSEYNVRELVAKKGRKTASEKAAIEAEMANLAYRLANMPTPTPPSAEQVRQDRIMFAALGSTYNRKGYENWTQDDFDTVGERLDAAQGRVQGILTEWDEKMEKVVEELDPLLAYATETPEERAKRWKFDAIVHETSIYKWKEASKARDHYLKNQQRILAGKEPLPYKGSKVELLGTVYITEGDVDNLAIQHEMAALGINPNAVQMQDTKHRPSGGEETGLAF